jgi:hypothetical protein
LPASDAARRAIVMQWEDILDFLPLGENTPALG